LLNANLGRIGSLGKPASGLPTGTFTSRASEGTDPAHIDGARRFSVRTRNQVHEGDPNFMTSLARGLAVICAFSDHRRSLTIPQISERTSFSRAAVRRCLYTLAKLGYVSSGPRSFELEPKILELGHAYLSSTPLASAAQPILDRLCEAVRESCSLSILDGDDILYVARSSTTARILSVDLGVGSRLPAYCTSMGRVLLAYQSHAESRKYFARAKFSARTKRTIISRAKLMEELADVRKKQYAIVDQELEMGLRSIAVPVTGKSGAVVAAMNAGTQAARVSIGELKEKIYPQLKEAAARLSLLLF
jgi:IclR family transcriptional regulator, pca regulon regulatory protein